MPSRPPTTSPGRPPGCPGEPASVALAVRHQPKWVFGISRNDCSASSEIGVRLRPKSPFAILQNGCSSSPVIHTGSAQSSDRPVSQVRRRLGGRQPRPRPFGRRAGQARGAGLGLCGAPSAPSGGLSPKPRRRIGLATGGGFGRGCRLHVRNCWGAATWDSG